MRKEKRKESYVTGLKTCHYNRKVDSSQDALRASWGEDE
jgi:hypothetical protein